MKDFFLNHTTVFRFIREILRAQVNRIGVAFQTIVETLEAADATYTLQNGQTEFFKNKKRDLRK
jgi:ABC-type branched-subunit amino acid transport system ATPase component